LWILPYSEEHYTFFDEIAKEVDLNAGEAFIMKTHFLEDTRSKTITECFNSARDEEYKEFLDKCEDFFKEIEKETAKSNFIYAEIEENEDELEKLNTWIEKILKRDFFSSPLREKSHKTLLKCKEVLEVFSSKVYELHGAM
jgi:flavodoxin